MTNFSIARSRATRVPSVRPKPTRKATAVRLLAIAAMAGTFGALYVSTPASAGSNTYCWGQVFYSGVHCTGPQHALRQNWAQNHYGNDDFVVGAGAVRPSGTFYGEYMYGAGEVCHPYSGLNQLMPRAYNPDLPQTMGGTEYWGSEPGCP